MGLFRQSACTQCGCRRFLAQQHILAPGMVTPGDPASFNVERMRMGPICQCGHDSGEHRPPWLSRPLLRLWPRGPVLLTRWALIVFPLSLALVTGLSVNYSQPGTEGSPTPLTGDALQNVRLAVMFFITGFASPPIRRIYRLARWAVRIAIVLLALYIVGLLGVQAGWWEPFSVGPIDIKGPDR